MAKTYGTVTTFTAGSVLTAAQLNVAGGAINNLVLPPSAQIFRTANYTYTSASVVALNGTSATYSTPNAWDTDSMTGTASTITIQTTGLYVVTFIGNVTGTTTITQSIVGVQVNGTRQALHYAAESSVGTSAYWDMSVVLYLTASDALTGRVDVSGGGTLTISGTTTQDYTQTRLSATWIGRTS